MASKQAAQPAADEPDAKKAKVEKEPEEAAFQEPDAPKDNRPVLKETITFNNEDATLNVVPTLGGKMLSSLTEGGMSYLVAGARANVGQKAGRYMFEVKVVCNIFSTHVGNLRPKPMLRIGFSTSASSLVVGDDNGGVCFDGDGSFITERKRDMNGCQKYGREHVLAVVLNLDSKSPNFNTMAIYRDGVSISKAMPLPEALKGKPLFPHVAFRNVSVSVNFGPKALSELPFKCRMLQAAAGSDVVVAPQKKPKDGKYELMLPVSFPDEGTFDWLDSFLEKNPHYTELSDRMIVEWARASGLWTKASWKSTNDKPAFNFGIPAMDDYSVRRIMNAVAPVVPRNYVVMEVKSNLLSDERRDILKKFNYPCYKKVAHVVMGAPNEDFKGFVQNKILKDKQSVADAAWKAKKEAKAKVKRDKEVQLARRKFEEQKEAAAKEAKEAAQKEEKDVKDEAKQEAKDESEVKEETEVKAEKDADADVKMEEKVETKEEVESDAEPPVVELTDEEKAKTFVEKKIPDLGEKVLSTSFGKFTTPDEEEGFDEIRYEWLKEDEAKSYLKKWVLNKKQTTRIDDLKPGQAFKDSLAAFEKSFPAWKDKQKAFASAANKKAAKKKDDDDDEDEIDIAAVTDVMDIGEGQPLFEKFDPEDWMLTKLRFELAALLTAFAKDVDDPDRVGIPVDHFQFYYGKYFGSKTLDPKTFGKKDMNEVVAMIKDVVIIKDGNFVSQLSGDAHGPDHFLKLAETNRRERQRRIDAGDESARIKFPEPEPEKPKANPYPAKDASEKGGKKGGKGFKGERVVGAAFVPLAAPKAESIALEPAMDQRKDLPAWATAKGDGKVDKAGYKGKGFDKDSKAAGCKGKISDASEFGRPKSFGAGDYGKAPSDYGKASSNYGKASSDYGKASSDYGKAGDYGKASSDYGKAGSEYGKAYGKDKSKDKGGASSMDVDEFSFGDEAPVVVPKVVAPKSRVVPPRGKSSALPPSASFDGKWGQAEESAWDSQAAEPPPVVVEEEKEESWGPRDSSYSSDKNASWNKDSNSSWSRNDSWGSKSDRGSWDRKKYDNNNSYDNNKSWDSNDKSSNSWDSPKKSWDRQDNRSWDNQGNSKSWEQKDTSSKSWGSQDANNPWEP